MAKRNIRENIKAKVPIPEKYVDEEEDLRENMKDYFENMYDEIVSNPSLRKYSAIFMEEFVAEFARELARESVYLMASKLEEKSYSEPEEEHGYKDMMKDKYQYYKEKGKHKFEGKKDHYLAILEDIIHNARTKR